MEDLHLGSETSVAGIRGVDDSFPLCTGLDDGPICTGGVPDIVTVAGKATECYAGPCGTGGEDVGVGTDQDIGHHCAGASAHGEDTVCVAVVFAQGVFYHADYSERITATVMRKCFAGRDVPAVVSGVGRVGEDHDVAVGICQCRELGTSESVLG